MIGFFMPIAEALIAGYLAAIVVYTALLFCITRLGGRVLLNDNRASMAYSSLHTGTWTIAAFIGAYLCCGMAPLAPYGLVGFPALLALILAALAFRNFRQLPGQVSLFGLLLIVIGIATGTVGALYLHHAFLAIRNA